MIRLFTQQTYTLALLSLLFGTSCFAADLETPTDEKPSSILETVAYGSKNGNSDLPFVVAREANDVAIDIDGVVDESVWLELPPHTEFYVTDPDTLDPAELRSEWRLFYSDRGLYVGVNLEQDPTMLVERLSARDLGFLNRDYVSFVLDTSGEGRYGYWFQLNLGGSRSDGTIQPERQFSDSWDGAWYGETARTANGWSAEFFVPWSILSMPQSDNERKMSIIMQRNVAYLNQRHAFPPLPFTKPKYISAFQKLSLLDVNPSRQLSFFPQLSSTYDNLATTTKNQAGIDVFWRPSTNFQITGTANPDFGTVEADSVIINLTAVETFFPEKRLFFLEGQEIFVQSSRGSSWSGTPVTLLHTRRIGQRPIRPSLPIGGEFDSDQFRLPAELLGATKATGQIGGLRYGVLGAFEDDTMFHGQLNDEAITVGQEGRDFGVLRSRWDSGSDSYKSLGFMSTRMEHPAVLAQTHSLDGRYFTASGNVRVESQVLMSDITGEDNGYGGFVTLDYSPSQGITHQLLYETYDDRLNLAHMGYLRRNDLRSFEYEFGIKRSSERFKETDFEIDLEYGTNGLDQVIDASISVSQDFTFNNNTRFRMRARHRPEKYDDQNSFGNGSFLEGSESMVEFRYSSDSSRRFYFNVSTGRGTEELEGTNTFGSTFLLWRTSDRLTVHSSISYSQNDSWLLYRGDRRFTAFTSEGWSPRLGVDYFMTSKQHLRFDMQWRAIKAHERSFYRLPEDETELHQVADPNLNGVDDFAISRMNLQLRYRWELAPMSDLFVVYSKRAALPDAVVYGFAEQLTNTFVHPTAEGLVVKYRHHLGS